MIERRRGTRFGVEATPVRWIGAKPGEQQLDSDRAAKPGVPPVADLGPAAASQNSPQFVAAAEHDRGRHEVNANPP
jgi:hypothetical protein